MRRNELEGFLHHALFCDVERASGGRPFLGHILAATVHHLCAYRLERDPWASLYEQEELAIARGLKRKRGTKYG